MLVNCTWIEGNLLIQRPKRTLSAGPMVSLLKCSNQENEIKSRSPKDIRQLMVVVKEGGSKDVAGGYSPSYLYTSLWKFPLNPSTLNIYT